jgi:hypothetical protein
MYSCPSPSLSLPRPYSLQALAAPSRPGALDLLFFCCLLLCSVFSWSWSWGHCDTVRAARGGQSPPPRPRACVYFEMLM